MNERKEKEYERFSAEILQDQRIRIALFTFSITATGAIIGLSNKISSSSTTGSSLFQLVIVFAVYSVLIPSIILVFHYTRGINCKSEYLRIALGEQWMAHFDRLTEEIIPNSSGLAKTHRILVKIGGYSTENAFKISFILLNILTTLFAVTRIGSSNYISLVICASFFFSTIAIIIIFRPISKKQYRELWKKSILNNNKK